MGALKEIHDVTSKSIENSQELLEHSWEYYKLKLFKHTAEMTLFIVKLTLFSLVGLMVLALFSLALAIFLGNLLQSMAMGYVLTASIYLLLAGVIYLFRKKLEKFIVIKLSKSLLQDD